MAKDDKSLFLAHVVVQSRSLTLTSKQSLRDSGFIHLMALPPSTPMELSSLENFYSLDLEVVCITQVHSSPGETQVPGHAWLEGSLEKII